MRYYIIAVNQLWYAQVVTQSASSDMFNNVIYIM